MDLGLQGRNGRVAGASRGIARCRHSGRPLSRLSARGKYNTSPVAQPGSCRWLLNRLPPIRPDAMWGASGRQGHPCMVYYDPGTTIRTR